MIVNDQSKIDKILIELDGTEQKKKLGANAILAVSIASCKLAAIDKKYSLYKYLGNSKKFSITSSTIKYYKWRCSR